MSVKQSCSKLVPFAVFLGVFQGLAWTILSILGIVARFTEIEVSTTHSELLISTLTGLMQGDEIDAPLKGKGLFAVVIAYLVISTLWIIVSVLLFFSTNAQRQDNLDGVKVGWGVTTLVVCIYDVIVTGMLAANYQKCLDMYNDKHAELLYLLIAYGTLISLAARGYVLWIVNLVVTILMLKSTRNQMTKANTDGYDSSSIDAFDESRNYPTHTNHGYGPNHGHSWENEESRNDPRTPSGIHRNHPGHTNHGYGWENEDPKSGVHNYNPADRVAGLGKQDPRSYPKNVFPPKPPNNYRYNAPNIPQPDYNSPSQQLKPAMKRYPPPPPNPKFNRNDRY